MGNKLKSVLVLLILFVAMWSCEFDYKLALNSATREGKYVAEKTYNMKSGETVTFAPGTVQYLIFSNDTMKIIRNDTIIEKLVNYDFIDWQKKKDGKAIFKGLASDGVKSLLIEVVNIRHDGSTLILSPVMKDSYQESLDTVKTYYREVSN